MEKYWERDFDEMKRFSVITILIFVTFSTAYSQSWKGVRPLYSTKPDVENVVGTSKEKEHAWGVRYETDNEKITVRYALKTCDQGWNVPKDTVLSIEISSSSDTGKSADELKLDRTKFFVMGDDAVYGTWTNPEAGVQYYFMHMERALQWIKYIPARIDNTFRCNGFPPYVPEAQYFTMDEYLFHNPKRDRKDDLNVSVAYLQNFMITLRNQSPGEFKGYVLIYFDNKLPITEYRRRVARAKLLVSRTMKLSPNELTFIEGGMKAENELKMYILRKHQKPPAPEPELPSPQFMKKPSKKNKNGINKLESHQMSITTG